MKHHPEIKIFLVLALSVSLCGCETFRKTFSRTPNSMKRTVRHTPKATPRRRGETGDKLFDTVFRRGKPERSRLHTSELNDSERRLVESSFYAIPRNANDDPDVRRIQQRNQRSKQRRKDDVFGTRNGSFF